MIYGGKELAEAFRTVRRNTITIAEEIGEEHYAYRPAPGSRTVAHLLTHIALMPRLQHQVHGVEGITELTGFDFPAFMHRMWAEEQLPRSKAQIVALLKDDGDRYGTWLETLSEEFLAVSVMFPPGFNPPSKTRFEMILSSKEHEMHHRGQLMVIERMLGIVPHLTRVMQERIEELKK